MKKHKQAKKEKRGKKYIYIRGRGAQASNELDEERKKVNKQGNKEVRKEARNDLYVDRRKYGWTEGRRK